MSSDLPQPRMPLLFVGHGSPMNIVLDNAFTRSLKKLAAAISKPSAVLVISAHWLTRGTFVSGQEDPPQIYDFYGFPEELYRVKYPAPGSVAVARRICDLAGERIRLSKDWGLDHAAWSILQHLFPQADVPVVELSLDIGKSEKEHYKLARFLLPLRREGVLIIGSGNLIHNLGLMAGDIDAPPFPWAQETQTAIKRYLRQGEHGKLVDYQENLPHAAWAVPTNDHYLPLLYAIALQEPHEPIVFFHRGIQYASVSMMGFQIGK